MGENNLKSAEKTDCAPFHHADQDDPASGCGWVCGKDPEVPARGPGIGQYRRMSVLKIFRRAVKKAGANPLATLHRLRHFFTST